MMPVAVPVLLRTADSIAGRVVLLVEQRVAAAFVSEELSVDDHSTFFVARSEAFVAPSTFPRSIRRKHDRYFHYNHSFVISHGLFLVYL